MSGRNSPQHITPSAEALALSRLRVKSISHPLQQCQITIYVPPNAVGAVIGRGGKTILNVQKEALKRSLGHTGAVRISVLGGNNSPSNAAAEEGEFFSAPQAAQGATWNYHEYHSSVQKEEEDAAMKTDEEDDEFVPVIIRGDPVGCFAAVRQITTLVYNRHDPDVVFEVPIHRSKHNLLVGKGGLILAALSAENEVRIMIPPNDLMENVDGTVNYWQQQHQYRTDTGSTMLFSQDANGTYNDTGEMNSPLAINAQTTLPPNVIQLEGPIENCEKALVKMLSIVSGEKWVPTGYIVHDHVNEQYTDQDDSIKNTAKSENIKAFAVLTAGHDSPCIGQNKLRTIQRKTSTLIRRKKGRFMLKGVEYGKTTNDADAEEVQSMVDNEDDDEKEDVEEEEVGETPSASVSFLISGKMESVKLAAAQLEMLLGLEANSAIITLKQDPLKSSSPTAKGDPNDDAAEKKRQKQRNRRDKKRVNKNQKDTQDAKVVGE